MNNKQQKPKKLSWGVRHPILFMILFFVGITVLLNWCENSYESKAHARELKIKYEAEKKQKESAKKYYNSLLESSDSSSGSSSSGKSSSGSSSSGSGSSSKSSGWSSYDAGYDSWDSDEDYDDARYETDPDYAAGVDDAIDDLGW